MANSLENDPHFVRGYWRGVRRSLVEMLVIAAMWAVAFLAAIASCSVARASNCGQFFHHHQQVVAVAPVVAAPIYYQAGRDIEAEAIAAKVAKLVIGQLRAELNAPQRQTAMKQSALAQHCAKCHSGATPKGNVTYDGVTALACVQVTAALRSIAKEEMPKDHKLTPEQKGAVMQELLDLEQPADRSRPVEIPPPAPGVLQ